jgi:hypothetical protein
MRHGAYCIPLSVRPCNAARPRALVRERRPARTNRLSLEDGTWRRIVAFPCWQVVGSPNADHVTLELTDPHADPARREQNKGQDRAPSSRTHTRPPPCGLPHGPFDPATGGSLRFEVLS